MSEIKAQFTDALEERIGQAMIAGLKRALIRVANNQIARMRLRVQGGKGTDDQQMPRYSKAYARARRKRGRQDEHRDLSMTGRMVGAIHLDEVKVEHDGLVATITIAGARNREVASYNQKRSPWFGFSPSEEVKIIDAVRKEVDMLLREKDAR